MVVLNEKVNWSLNQVKEGKRKQIKEESARTKTI